MDGVLASWAVPQGPPLVGGKRRLAVHTEDHPLQYLTFEGEIPDGYGAGTMRIWDTGTYELESRSEKELKVTFHGRKLTGGYVLVQTRQNEGRDWLMIKHAPKERGHPLESRIQPMLATLASEPFDSPDWAFEPKWDGVRAIAFVDGGEVRLQTRNLRDCTAQYPEVDLSVAQALLGGYQAIIDGEIVAPDPQGRPSFQLLQPRMHQTSPTKIRALRAANPVVYYAFDLLWLDGQDLAARPLRERKKLLAEVLQPLNAVRLSEHVVGDGVALFSVASEKGIEGIVAKRLDAPYVEGRSALWLKVKAKREVECVVIGWTEGQGGRASTLGSLLLGRYGRVRAGGGSEADADARTSQGSPSEPDEEERLVHVGHVGSGFDERTLHDLLAQLRERETRSAPIAKPLPKTNAPAHWVTPDLVCSVEFAEWTDDGKLRHPTYKGLRYDVEPRECRGQEASIDPGTATRRAETEKREARLARTTPTLVPAVLEVDGRTLRLSNLEKVLFPEDGYTKTDLIRYYVDVSPYLLPYLRDRPLTLKPYPDGIHGTRFYQKDKPGFTPQWVRTFSDFSDTRQEEIDHVVCNDLATLVWLANYTCIEMHPWLSRIDDPEHPDFVMIDLDPQPGASFADVKAVARFVREFLEGRKLVGFPKTTGSRGIHVLVPVARGYTYEEVREFVQEIAAAAQKRLPGLITRDWNKAQRGAQVMVDYLQNRRGATTAGPYSVRPRPGAPVSAPFAWDELDDLRASDQFTMANLRGRLAAVGDPLAPAYGMQQRLR